MNLQEWDKNWNQKMAEQDRQFVELRAAFARLRRTRKQFAVTLAIFALTVMILLACLSLGV